MRRAQLLGRNSCQADDAVDEFGVASKVFVQTTGIR
jgi:hypothetical protein